MHARKPSLFVFDSFWTSGVYQEIRPLQHYFRIPFNHISPTFTIHLPTTRFRIVGKLLEVRQCETQTRRRLNFPLQLCRVTEFRSLAALKGHTRSFHGRGKYTLSTICPIFKLFQRFFKQFYRCRTKFSYLYHKCLHDCMIKTDWFSSTRSC